LSEWRPLGTAPLTIAEIPRWGYYRIRATRLGYVTTDAILSSEETLSVALMPEADTPAGMVWVPPLPPDLPGYWLGRFEVTNAQLALLDRARRFAA
jgi:hypothetical protein